jgi:hypothetical protein
MKEIRLYRATFNLYRIYVSNFLKIYRMSQDERSIFWEVTVSVILSKKDMCPIPNGF